jgi:hypothetical protein
MAKRNVDCEAKYALSSLALQFSDSIVLKASIVDRVRSN